MAEKLNKAERFVKRKLHEKFGFYIDRDLSYDRERAAHHVYFEINRKLNNPDRWPPEYRNAYERFCIY